MKIALLQFEIVLGDVAANLNKVRALIEEARNYGAHLALLPELWSTGYDLENAAQHALAFENTVNEISGLARAASMTIVGSILEPFDGGAANCQVVFDDVGREVARYRKVHLFAPMLEDQYLRAGNELRAAAVCGVRTGLSVCYDLRFPELYRRYAVENAQLALVSAEWPAVRVAHWRALLQARAIENQIFIAACNACGQTGNTVFGGNSGVWSPLGEQLVAAGENEGVFCAEVDPGAVAEIRAAIPILSDRRPELYT